MIQPTNHMKLKKKENESVYASILLRRGNKIITEDRGRKVPGGREVREGKKGAGSGIGRDRRQVQRVRKSNRNM